MNFQVVQLHVAWGPVSAVEDEDVQCIRLSHRRGKGVAENPAQLSADELEIVDSWQHALVGKFYVLRHLSKYTVFFGISSGAPSKAYGVLGLADPLEEVIGPYLPRLITTVLLPFKGRIIFDGLVSGYNITFGTVNRRARQRWRPPLREAGFDFVHNVGRKRRSLDRPLKR